jgi:hypothetical protein
LQLKDQINNYNQRKANQVQNLIGRIRHFR